MTRLALALCLAVACANCSAGKPSAVYEAKEGDIIFQSFPANPLTVTIEGVTRSRLSHCGIVHKDGENWVVMEAIGPVQKTPLDSWIARGRDARYEVYRLRKKYQKFVPAFMREAKKFMGRPYDIHYTFDDQKIYCSELVFKAYGLAAGENLGKIEALGDLQWRDHVDFIKQIEGGDVPLERQMITPKSLAKAPQLHRVFTNYNSAAHEGAVRP
jgi:hypothetical protein